MMLGQAAGTAAALAQKGKISVQRVDAVELQRRLKQASIPFQKP
jgi:hypothetical protein